MPRHCLTDSWTKIQHFNFISFSLGDRITSLTIDFRHIVQEDAQTIMSYASPYNVQLEVVDGKLPAGSQSPQSGHSTLQHPLYRSRSSSNEDLNTVRVSENTLLLFTKIPLPL
jgi:hypothetical protein